MSVAQRIVRRFLAASAPSRDRGTGQYMHSKWSRICKLCGHPVGQHTAEKKHGLRPCLNGDLYEDCSCPVFTPSPKFMTDEEFDRYTKGSSS